MLNISNNSINKNISLSNFKSGRYITNKKYYRQFNRLSIAFLIALLIVLFLPWTQNITGKGYVTTLKPSQRPQTIQSSIPGRIEKWFVQEGNYVKKGDTILRISEIKSAYFDDKLIERTQNQIQSKSKSVGAYQGKSLALQKQIKTIKDEQVLKLKQIKNKWQQAKLKVSSDSIDLQAAKTNKIIAQTQFERTLTLQKEGLKAIKDVEDKRLKLQAAQAKFISQENKLLQSRNSVLNTEIEFSRTNATYSNKIHKTTLAP